MKHFLPISSKYRGVQMGNVIDINAKLNQNRSQGSSGELKPGAVEQGKVVDISIIRSEALKADRRQVRRTILTEFISVHTLVPGMGLMKVSLYDITEKGLAFDTEIRNGRFQVGEEIAMRVYLNQQTYFPFIVKIKHVQEVSDEEVCRHGGEFVQGTINDIALHHFVKFIETVSAALKQDHGDVLVSNLKS